jgi:hypothetical protein
MFRNVIRVIVITQAIALAAGSASAQTAPVDPPFKHVAVSTRVVKPGMQAAVEEYFTKLRAAEAKLGIRGLTDVYVVAQGARTPTYVTSRTLRSWAELDVDNAAKSREMLVRAYGEKEAARLGTALGLASESVTSEVQTVMPGLGNYRPGKDGGHYNYLHVRRNYVKPGMQGQYTALVAKMREVRAAAGAAPEYRWTIAEGPVAVFGTTRYFDSWKDRDLWENEMGKVLGEAEAAKWSAQFEACLDHAEAYVVRRRPDLSHASQPAASTRQ